MLVSFRTQTTWVRGPFLRQLTGLGLSKKVWIYISLTSHLQFVLRTDISHFSVASDQCFDLVSNTNTFRSTIEKCFRFLFLRYRDLIGGYNSWSLWQSQNGWFWPTLCTFVIVHCLMVCALWITCLCVFLCIVSNIFLRNCVFSCSFCSFLILIEQQKYWYVYNFVTIWPLVAEYNILF